MDNLYRKSRLRAGMSPGQAAERCLYIDVKTLWNYENDVIVPGEEMVFQMARAYNDLFLIFEHFFEKTKTGLFFKEIFQVSLNRSEGVITTLNGSRKFDNYEVFPDNVASLLQSALK